MSKAKGNTNTPTRKVRILAAGRLVFNGQVLHRVGEVIEAPIDEANGWIAQGLAAPSIRIRALKENVTVENRTLAAGEEFETDEEWAVMLGRHGVVTILNPADLSTRVAPPVDLAPEPKPEPKPVKLATVRSLRDGLSIGNRVTSLGEEVEVEEGLAVSAVARGAAEGVGLDAVRLAGKVRELKRSGQYDDSYNVAG